jgi:hypothetical protein
MADLETAMDQLPIFLTDARQRGGKTAPSMPSTSHSTTGCSRARRDAGIAPIGKPGMRMNSVGRAVHSWNPTPSPIGNPLRVGKPEMRLQQVLSRAICPSAGNGFSLDVKKPTPPLSGLPLPPRHRAPLRFRSRLVVEMPHDPESFDGMFFTHRWPVPVPETPAFHQFP